MEKQEDGSMIQCHMKKFEPPWWLQVGQGLSESSDAILLSSSPSPLIFTICDFFHLDDRNRNPFYFPKHLSSLQIQKSWSQDFFPPQDTSPGSSCPLKRARICNFFSNTLSSQCQSVMDLWMPWPLRSDSRQLSQRNFFPWRWHGFYTCCSQRKQIVHLSPQPWATTHFCHLHKKFLKWF